MATDADGVTIVANDGVWYDDGHSADWVHGTAKTFPPNAVGIQPDGIAGIVSVPVPLVHKNKPLDPPDR